MVQKVYILDHLGERRDNAMKILENQTLIMENVLSYRGKLTQQEFAVKLQQIQEIIENSEASKNGSIATTTYAVEQNGNEQIMDVEILVPLDRKIQLTQEYTLKDKIFITNALKISHKGNPAQLQTTVTELNNYIVSNELIPITTCYNVTVREVEDPSQIDLMEIDIYVGISPNKL